MSFLQTLMGDEVRLHVQGNHSLIIFSVLESSTCPFFTGCFLLCPPSTQSHGAMSPLLVLQRDEEGIIAAIHNFTVHTYHIGSIC